jgi:hypothetical protein
MTARGEQLVAALIDLTTLAARPRLVARPPIRGALVSVRVCFFISRSSPAPPTPDNQSLLV